MNQSIRQAYKWHRQNGARATRATELAKADIEAGRARYPALPGNGIGSRMESGLQWVERPGDVGLRFVGFADELVERGIDHRGWYTEDEGGDVMRGAVYRLPARNGRAVYVAGYRIGSGRRGNWKDACGSSTGPVAIDLNPSSWEYGEQGEDCTHYAEQACRDQARYADSLAESAAEDSREYAEAWSIAQEWQDMADRAKAAKESARALIRDIRAAARSVTGALPASVCQTLRAGVRAQLNEAREALDRRQEIENNFGYWDHGRQIGIAEFAGANL